MNGEQDTLSGSPTGGGRAGGRRGIGARLLGIPLFLKILLANSAIVATVAASLALLAGRATATELAVGGALVGIALTIALNALIVRLALMPLAELQQTAERVQAGDAAARVPPSRLADRDLRRLGATFNAMLDADAEHRRRLRQIAVAALGAAEEERKRIARELHDGVAQELAALRIGVRVARNARDAMERDRLLTDLGEELGSQIDGLRTLATGLRPPALDMLGLAPAIESLTRQLSEQTGMRIRTEAEPLTGVLDAPAELAVYRIVQEALGNALKHAEAAHIDVVLTRNGRHVRASVHDDGRGFPVETALGNGAIGLFGMQERAAYVGGEVKIDSSVGRGTRVDVSIPIPEVQV